MPPVYDAIDERKIFTEASDRQIGSLCDSIDKGRLDVQADFQRKYVWDNRPELKSRLIESVLLKVPIPVVYVAEDDKGMEVVVDGQQRLRTFHGFRRKGGFKLKKLQILHVLNGKGYDELPNEIQSRIDEYPIRVIKIQKESHRDIKFDVFERLNKGSVKLNNQELRNCMYRGSLNLLLMDLVSNPDFMEIQNLRKPDPRMRDAERILRFFAFSDRGIQNYKSPSKEFLNLYMERNREITADERVEKSNLFKKCSSLCRSVFGNLAAHRWVKMEGSNGGYVASKFNDGILDMQMLGFKEYAKRDIMPRLQVIRDAYIDLACTDEFVDTVQIGTYGTSQTKRRMEMWLNRLREVAGYPSDDSRFYTSSDKDILFRKEGASLCAICGNLILDADDAHVDHIERHSDGGKTDISNAQLTHRYCNLGKG
ncbi:conserved hypothetical protein [Nitrosopumilaceae archaeon]|nr:conserved hypothetical protein [Nitrosopumilaceae archaeon]